MSDSKMTRREMTILAAGAAGAATLAATPAEAGQPNMQKALEYLEAALSRLERASANKGGHRVEAIKYTKAAIRETRKGIAFAS